MIFYINQNRIIVKNLGTNSMFPDGKGLRVNEVDGLKMIKIHDNSNLARKIIKAEMELQKYRLTNDLNDIEILDTQEDILRREKISQKNMLRNEIRKIDNMILNKVPELMYRFLDLLETLGFNLTVEEKNLLIEREMYIDQLNNLE